MHLNRKHQRTLEAIFSPRVPATLQWRRIEALFMALGATKEELRGSGVNFKLRGKTVTVPPTTSAKRDKAVSSQACPKLFRRGRNNTMKTMTYRGYTAEIIYSEEDECFVGDVVNIDDIICFHGDTDEELREAFENVVDLHIKVKEQPENPPQKTLRGEVAVAFYVKHFICSNRIFCRHHKNTTTKIRNFAGENMPYCFC